MPNQPLSTETGELHTSPTRTLSATHGGPAARCRRRLPIARRRRLRTTARSANAPERLKGLLKRFVGYPPTERRVQDLRYQLLTALAGTLSEAEVQGAQHAVLMVHEFLTDERPKEELLLERDRDLHNFVTTVFDQEPPLGHQAPWCINVSGMPWAGDRHLYLARAITDLRTATLERKDSDPIL
jgi:hypothetical protein